MAADAVLPTLTPQQKQTFEAFARDAAMSSVRISPNGERIMSIVRTGVDTDPLLFIYKTDELTKPNATPDPITLSAAPMEIVQAFFANDERIIVVLRQDIDTIERLGGSTRQAIRVVSVGVDGQDWQPLPKRNFDRRSKVESFLENLSPGSVFDGLVWDPDHILISDGDGNIYKVNVEDGSRNLVIRNSDAIAYSDIDFDGDVRLANRFEPADSSIVYLARLKGESNWFEYGRLSAGKMGAGFVAQVFIPLGFYNPEDPNELWVASNHESDKTGVYSFDLKEKKFKELLFRHNKYDASSVATKVAGNSKPITTGFRYSGKYNGEPLFTDEGEAALFNGLSQAFPDTRISIISRSADESRMIIGADGPRTPQSYYLYDSGRVYFLGTQYPELNASMLSRVEWTSYKARDGLEIPTLVTIPDGKGPFPAMVMPHGGPIARDNWGYDNWAQMLAHHGYVVIQPQFRISTGFGKKHLEAGFAQWGKTMQDDLDDAAAYLVKRGLAEKDNIGIFGWSYGGYAAFVGAARDPNPYRCAIAGAGVADIPLFRARIGAGGSILSRGFRQTLDGLNPLEMVDSVDIPILVIHGDKDERVRIEESDKFVAGLRNAGKQHEYLVLEGANHFFGTIYYEHYMQMFPKMIDWLDNTCSMKD